ncbi:MAG: universal stress protein [Steroidobacteraceae bacterium]
MYQRLLVPLDGSDTAARGLAEAIRLAAGQPVKLRLVLVVDEADTALAQAAWPSGELRQRIRAEGEAVLRDAAAQARAAGLEADTRLLAPESGVPGAAILAQAREWPADAIVMGTHGRGGVGRLLLGSCAEHVLRHATVPVLLVRRAGAA